MKNYAGIGVSGPDLINSLLKAMIGEHGLSWREEAGGRLGSRRNGFDRSSVAQLH